jgi:hypothetical protein
MTLPVAEADLPFLELMGSMILFFLWVTWIWTVIAVLGDLFRRGDVPGGSKALWTFFIIVVPFVGVLIYLAAHGQGMAERKAKEVEEARNQYEEHIRGVASGSAGEIAKAKELLDSGAIDQAEFDRIKHKALA